MDIIAQNVALSELWSRRDEYGLEFVLDEMNRLLEMGLISNEDFELLMATTASRPQAPPRNQTHAVNKQRPIDTQLPPAQVLAILTQHAESTKQQEWTNNVQDAVRDLISTILDQEKYSSLPDIQGQIEATLRVDMRPHLDWLQDTIFQQSKQKLKRINQAAESIRVGQATTRVQRAFRARRWALRRRARHRHDQTRLAADRVTRQAIEGYALDVVGRLIRRHVFIRRFRRFVLELQRQAVWQHALDILRRRVARRQVARWLRESWPRFKLAKETRLRRMELEASVATMAQSLARGFLVRRHQSHLHASAKLIQRQVCTYRQNKVQRTAATRLQMWTRRCLAVAGLKLHLRQRTTAAVCIQRMVRVCQHRRRNRNAVAVVEAWRCNHLAVRKAKEEIAKLRWQQVQLASCRSIQRRFRCFLRRLRKNRSAAACCIQRNVRRHQATVLRRQVAGVRIFRQMWAWRLRQEHRVQRVLDAVRQKCLARKRAVQTRQERARAVIASILQGWVSQYRQAKHAAATRLGRWMRRYLSRKRELLERRRRSSGRVPIRPPAKKPHTVPAALTKPPEPVQVLPPVRLVKRFERLCKTCHRHAHPHACEGTSSSSPVKKMVAVRTFGVHVTKATALRAHELLVLGDREHQRRLQSQPPFVAKPPALHDRGVKPSLRKSMSVRGMPKSNQEPSS